MCLRTLTGTTTRRKVGYKLLREFNGGLYTGYVQGREQLVTRHSWTTDRERYPIHLDNGSGRYPTGFHIFLTMYGVEKFRSNLGWQQAVVAKVKFSRVVAVGTQFGCQVIVARRIKLIRG